MQLFYNENIFDSALDYQLGGFHTNKTENFSYADIYNSFADKISDKVEEYLVSAVESYAVQGYDDPKQEAIDALGIMVEDNLKIEIPHYGKEYIINAIIDSDQSQKWLEKIKYKFENYPDNTIANQQGVTSISNAQTKLSKEATYIMEDCCLETILESLSTIEL